jgi:nitrous oxidase accessory protein
MLRLLLFCTLLLSYGTCSVLQNAIDNAKAGSTLKLDKGVYVGNIIINKPLSIIGKTNGVIIQGEGNENTITINSSYVTLKNLTVTQSGKRLDKLHSAIAIKKAKNITIDSCIIKQSLFGIDAFMVNDSVFRNNYITSRDNKISLKGDAFRLYYSHNNKITNNQIYGSRDIVLSYSNNNVLRHNHVELSRFAVLIERSHDIHIIENHFKRNAVGMIFQGAKNAKIQENQIMSGKGAAAIGVMVKGVDNFVFKNNIVSFNAKAFYIDAKHNEQSIKRFLTHNEISYNKEALHFHGAIKQNLIQHNTFIGNIEDVVKSVRGNHTSTNDIAQNYWDQYAGFDRNHDNIGDSTYKVFQYADQIWHYNNKIKFFYASPVISIVNFILNLAPFVEPVLLLEDPSPKVSLSGF